MKRNGCNAWLFVIAVALAPPLWASGPPAALLVEGRGMVPAFSDLDTDGDGLLSPEEAASTSPLDTHFPLADINSDGRIDEVEFGVFEALVETVPDLLGESI